MSDSSARGRRFRRWRNTCTLLSICIVLYLYIFGTRLSLSGDQSKEQQWGTFGSPSFARPSQDQLFHSMSLTEEQCKATFPGLTKDIEETISLGPFDIKKAGDMGPLQARIKDGQLYIIHAEPKGTLYQELLDSRTASLHQLHRAIFTSPSPLPDTIISLNIQDQPYGSAFSYSRPAYAAPTASGPPLTRAFLMPHFSFWSWPLAFVGSFAAASDAISEIEDRLSFKRKDSRVVWRGTTGFFSSHNPHMRADLVRVAGGRSWADVEALRWERGEGQPPEAGNHTAANALMVQDFCRYRYVIHTEGITYSGRFQFLQMCASVVLSPPIAWLQHTTHLIRPLFSSDLRLEGQPAWTPSHGEQEAWPVHYEPNEANIVFVAPDWSDLESTVKWLEAHPGIAEGIATRQRELFVGKGYLSPAAEVCYWRSLIRGWSKVVRLEGDGLMDVNGVRYEDFILHQEKGRRDSQVQHR